MNIDVITKWYTLLPAALSVGPVFSILGLDKLIHETILEKGGGKVLVRKNDLTNTLDSIVVGTPFWLSVSSIFLQPFWGGGFPVKYVALLLAGGAMKILYGRCYVDEYDVGGSSRAWFPLWTRKPNNLWDEIGRTFSKFAYPSVHTLAVMGAVLTGVSSPAAWVLLTAVCAWLVLSNRHWTSDVLSAGFLALAFKDLLG